MRGLPEPAKRTFISSTLGPATSRRWVSRSSAGATSRVPTTRPVAVINQTAAQRLFKDEDPIGKEIEGDNEKKYEVVAVVGNTKSRTLGEDPPCIVYHYLPHDFSEAISIFGVSIAVKTAGNPARLMHTVRNQISQLDRGLAVFGIETMSDHGGRHYWSRVCAPPSSGSAAWSDCCLRQSDSTVL